MSLDVNLKSVLAGLFVGLALLVTDLGALVLSSQSVDLIIIMAPVSFILSGSFIGSLCFGYLGGRAIEDKSSPRIWMYGVSFLGTLGLAIVATMSLGLITAIGIAVCLFLGGGGLVIFDRELGDEQIDGLLMFVLLINTILSLMFFFWGGIV